MAEQQNDEIKTWEYRVRATVNMVGGKWKSDWSPLDSAASSEAEAIEDAEGERGPGVLQTGLEEAMELAGFEWGVDVREVETESQTHE